MQGWSVWWALTRFWQIHLLSLQFSVSDDGIPHHTSLTTAGTFLPNGFHADLHGLLSRNDAGAPSAGAGLLCGPNELWGAENHPGCKTETSQWWWCRNLQKKNIFFRLTFFFFNIKTFHTQLPRGFPVLPLTLIIRIHSTKISLQKLRCLNWVQFNKPEAGRSLNIPKKPCFVCHPQYGCMSNAQPKLQSACSAATEDGLPAFWRRKLLLLLDFLQRSRQEILFFFFYLNDFYIFGKKQNIWISLTKVFGKVTRGPNNNCRSQLPSASSLPHSKTLWMILYYLTCPHETTNGPERPCRSSRGR